MTQPADPNQPDQETRGRRNLRRAKRAYDIYDRIDTWWGRLTNWPDYFRQLLTWFQTHTVAATATTVVAGGAAAAGAVAVLHPELLQGWLTERPALVAPLIETATATPAPPAPDLPPTPDQPEERVAVETILWGEAVVYPIEGVDAAGRRAAFDVAALPVRYAWARASATELTRDDAPLSVGDIETIVFAPAMREGLGGAAVMIAVGVASQEGNVVIETRRASRRADTAAAWMRRFVRPDAVVWTLNLGQYRPSCATDAAASAAWQRPVLFIGVREQTPEVDLRAALIDAMAGKSNLPDSACYSEFELTPPG